MVVEGCAGGKLLTSWCQVDRHGEKDMGEDRRDDEGEREKRREGRE